MSLFNRLINLVKGIEGLIKPILDAIKSIGGGIGGGISGGISSIRSTLGFAQGSTGLTRDQLVRLPGMEAGSGLIKAHVGEQVIPNGQQGGVGNNFVFNIKSIDPRGQTEEIRQVIETLFLERKLKVS